MRNLPMILVLSLFCINVCHAGDSPLKELWRTDIYGWEQVEDTLKAKLSLTNRVLIEDVNNDGTPDVVVGTKRLPRPDQTKGKVLALRGRDGIPLWERGLDCKVVGLVEIGLEGSSTIVAMGDSSASYFLRTLDGEVLQTVPVTGKTYNDLLAVSSTGELALVTGWGDSLQMRRPDFLKKEWEAAAEGNSTADEENGFLQPVLADVNSDQVDDVVLIDYWALRLVALDGRNGHRLWESNLARKKYKDDRKKKLSGDLVITSPCVADVNGDGKREVVVGTFGGAISVFSASDGSKIFQTQVSKENPMKKEIPIFLKPFLKLPKGGIIFHLVSADLNDDGLLDILATCFDQRVYALDGKNQKVLWSIKTDEYKENQIFSQPTIADMDGDGKLDVVVYNSSGNLHCIRGQDGTLLWTHQMEDQEGVQVIDLFLADLNGDGFMEVVIPQTKKGEVVAYSTDAPCKPGEIIWGMPKLNPQNNPVVERR